MVFERCSSYVWTIRREGGEQFRPPSKQAGLAYVKFALRRPEHLTVMFYAPSSKPAVASNPSKMKIKYPEAAEAAEESFRTLMNFVAACQLEGVLPAGDTKALALLAWSTVHGIAKLAITSRLPFSITKGNS